MNNNNNHHNHHLGVNRIGRNIRKSPIHQPSNPSQPQVYNISKNDFRNVVQQLTGTPSRDPFPNNPNPNPNPNPLPRPSNPPKPSSVRLHKIRPPPLGPIARPLPNPNYPPNPNFNPEIRPAFPPTPPALWGNNVAESPVSVYMRYLENSVLHPSQLAQIPPGVGPPPPGAGLLPTPPGQHAFPPPSGLLPSPGMPSPSMFLNLLSPRSPGPALLSPRFEFPPPLTPTFLLSPLSQNGGILGPGQHPLPSPGMFPPSPSWFLPSPRWRGM